MGPCVFVGQLMPLFDQFFWLTFYFSFLFSPAASPFSCTQIHTLQGAYKTSHAPHFLRLHGDAATRALFLPPSNIAAGQHCLLAQQGKRSDAAIWGSCRRSYALNFPNFPSSGAPPGEGS
eukprot:TRINITY_DN18524_c0_g1_i1.p1 TRINITY_DN18524_c0_g1~~TRINITY_DN18524_c0_g1_i1.p1  ORF type:complete len:120 (-),score=1.32 TRINITY_DN18524_c0_g1_i1:462-821(-)